jgi:hypothetical protein
MLLFMYLKGTTIIKIHLPATCIMLILLVQLVIRGCVATITSSTNAEDLGQFSRGPELCPGKIGWPQVPAPPTSAPFDAAAAAVQVEDALADLTLEELLNNNIGAITSSGRNCPRDPPVRCLDPQCRGSDDWKTETSSIPRCNRADGKLVIDGTETDLPGCPCCPEYIACSSSDCNGGANQACTSVPLHGCFCDWPGRGPQLTSWEPVGNGPDIYIYDADAFLDDPDYHPLGGQRSTSTAVSFTASSSMHFEARPLATQGSIAPAMPQNFTWMDLLSRRQEAFSLSQNASVFVMPDHFKHT